MNKNIYYSKYFITFAHSFSIFLVIVLINHGFDLNYKAFVVAAIVISIFILIGIRYYKTSISDTKLESYDAWGRRHSIELNRITKIKPIQIALLRYVRVMDELGKRPVWIPLFLNDLNGFKIELEKHLSPENILVSYLEDYINNHA